MVAAVASNGVIGEKGRLPWHFPSDLEAFRRLTTGATVVFGRKTYESLPGPLPERKIIVVSRNQFYGGEDHISVSTPEDIAIKYLLSKDICYIGGGESMYRLFFPLAAKVYLTRIEKAFDGDRRFPLEGLSAFDLVSARDDVDNGVRLSFEEYRRSLPAHEVG